jgi:hypothetical protein
MVRTSYEAAGRADDDWVGIRGVGMFLTKVAVGTEAPAEIREGLLEGAAGCEGVVSSEDVGWGVECYVCVLKLEITHWTSVCSVSLSSKKGLRASEKCLESLGVEEQRINAPDIIPHVSFECNYNGLI